MKKTTTGFIICILIFMTSCNTSDSNTIEKWKMEIEQVEKEFNDLAQQEGITKAFATYAANDGVIKRKGKLIKGKQAIAEWYQKDSKPNESLTWKPDFIDVSSSGDLAYTYGTYIFSSVDSTGTARENTGTFHTVWKRQADGSWKFVWD